MKGYRVRLKTGVTKIRRISYPSNWIDLSATVKLRDGNRCVCCSSTDRLQVHHIIPLSKNGTNSQSNLITLCEKCHASRHKDNKYMRGRVCSN